MIVLEMKAVVKPSQCSAIDEAIRTVQFIRNKAWLFRFLCGNEAYTDSFFGKIVVKVFLRQHFTIP
jgi:hypothetical protein